ncbi:MAG TPA: hypothetical protein EYQ00_08415 [Dehalococcoidia bacterium]|nr:hypothetical protein [Dehalococcoidia bacterium]
MRTKTFKIGDTVRMAVVSSSAQKGPLGIVVRKFVTETTGTEIYEVLFEDGRLVTKLPDYLQFVIIRQDGVEVNG